MSTSSAEGQRTLSYPAFAVVVVVYLAIIQGVGLVVQSVADLGDEPFTTTRGVVLAMWIPLGLALVFTYGVVFFLRWQHPVLVEDRAVRRWVWAVPVILLISILLATDYGALADSSAGLVLALLVATQLVGWGEEGMFRGVGVTTLRRHGLIEGRVALWSSLIFGAVHLSNVVSRGVGALPQALVVSLAGYFFYLTRRVSGGNAVNSVLHGLFDFALLTGTVVLVDQEPYAGSLAAILVYVVLGALLLVRRRRIEPESATA